MTIPNEMKAIDIKEPGGPEMLVPVTVPIPDLTSDQVLIKNEAVGVNRPDVAQRTGNYPVPPDANPLPGLKWLVRSWLWARRPEIGKSVKR